MGGPQQVRTEQVSRCAQVTRQEVHAGPWRGCWYIGQCTTEDCQRGRWARLQELDGGIALLDT